VETREKLEAGTTPYSGRGWEKVPESFPRRRKIIYCCPGQGGEERVEPERTLEAIAGEKKNLWKWYVERTVCEAWNERHKKLRYSLEKKMEACVCAIGR